jgi:crossover junction endodeoxyribonuclease RuvC|tara:strand:- start:2913 stop:3437 length:525 start_codon:yes stop_codon:yes gene_type:complete
VEEFKKEINCFVGVDPGLSGGISIFKNNRYVVFPMPTKKNILRKKTKRDMDIQKLVEIFDENIGFNSHVIAGIELVHAMPQQGVSSTFLFGRTSGIVEGCVGAFGYESYRITPQVWKKFYPDMKGLDRKEQKDLARELASDMAPYIKDEFRRKKDDGKAEALLIANYVKENYVK